MDKAERKTKHLADRDRIKAIMESEGAGASMKLACQIDWQNFLDMPWWEKPLFFLRLCITTPIILLVFLVIVVFAIVLGFFGIIVRAFMEHFWKAFAITCLTLTVIVLFATGVF